MRFKMIALALALGMTSVAASADQGYRITLWSQFSWYSLYSAYGEPDLKVDAAVYKAALALRKNRDEALAELKPLIEGGAKDPTVLLMYGYLLFESNDLSASHDILGKGAAAAAEPGRPEWVRTWVRGACLQWQAYADLGQGRPAEVVEAGKLVRAALEAYPDCPEKQQLADNLPAIESLAKGEEEKADTLAKAAAEPSVAAARKVLKVLEAEAERNWSPFNNLPGTANGHRADDWENHHKWMDFAKALPASEVLLANAPEDPDVVRMHHFILCGVKKWKEAEDFGVKAIQIVEKSGDRECLFWVLHTQAAFVWDNLLENPDPANIERLRQYNRRELAARAGAIAEELNNDNLRFRAFIQMGFLGVGGDTSVEYYEKAFALAQKNHWTDRTHDSMFMIAQRLAFMGKLDESEEWARKAGIQPHIVVRVQRGDWQYIYDHEKPSIDGFEQMTLRAPNERLQREVVGANQRGAYDYAITACMHLGKQDEAVEIAERLLNRTLGMILGAKFEESKAASLAQRKDAQSAAQSHVAALTRQLALARQTSDAAAVESVQRDLQVQATALQQVSADVAADELEVTGAKIPPHMTVKQMQALLPADAAVLLYFVPWVRFVDEGFIAFVTDTECKVYPCRGLFLPDAGDTKPGIEPIVQLYVKAIQTPAPGPDPAELRKANDALYELLLKPVADDIKSRKHLIIIPGGLLVQVPMHLLRDPAGKLLLEEHSVSYVPSFGVLRYALARNRRVGGEVTVIANPALPNPNSSLKFAEMEAAAIREVFPKANVLLGAQATATAVKQALTTADVLHFACHGLLNADYPMKSALALAPDDQSDGRLTASEICSYPVKAGLVVLSACESGSGGMSTGWVELVGMSRAWLLAGAPSVVVSLWKLDDRATSELMAEFYKNLKTMGRAEALQQAQLVMMKRYENPYYWGAFVLYGDYR
jgi:tetratricopeptide (TPR) repeat protein